MTYTPPSGYTEQLDTTYAAGRNIEISTKTYTSAGATGGITLTASAASAITGQHIAVRAAPVVAYTRDVADRIITRSVAGVVAAKFAFTGAGDSS